MVRTTLVTMIGNFYLLSNFQLGIWPRSDKTGAGVIDVNPSLLSNYATENVDLYIK